VTVVTRTTGSQRGFSVVELMVAMLLSLILLAGVVTVVASSKVTYAENERVARLQETGRVAIELILRDVRAAGFRGCAREVPFRNLLNDANELLWNFAEALQGFESLDAPGSTVGGSWAPALPGALVPNAIGGTDVLVVRSSAVGASTFGLATSMASPTGPLVVFDDQQPPLASGQPLLLSDCSAAAVFAFTGSSAVAPVAGAPALELQRAGPVSSGPGNATEDLGTEFPLGAQIVPIDTIIYYIAPASDGGGPALWRRFGAAAPVELVAGVEGLQVLYGEDQNNDRLVDEYLPADGVGDFGRVIAVSIAMLVRSAQADAPVNDTRTYDLLGVEYGPFDDRFQRLQLSTTATLRNQTD
jgi:type IV pilus assembly protein PilW